MKTFNQFITEVTKRHIELKKNKKSQNVDIEAERGEFERYPNSKELMSRAKNSRVRNLSQQEVESLSNSDAPSIKQGSAKGRRAVRRLGKTYGRDVERVKNQIKSNTDQPSIVMKTPQGHHELIAGNTRASMRRALNRPVRALVIGPDKPTQ